MDVAYVDESMRKLPDGTAYLLGATVFKDGPEAVISALLPLKGKRAKKLHWRDMGRKSQVDALRILGSSSIHTVVVVAEGISVKRQERARKKCLEALLISMERDGIFELVMESRHQKQDKEDVACAGYLRSAGAIRTIRISHELGRQNPRLWVPDLILGAYGEALSADSTLPQDWQDAWKSVERLVTVERAAL